MRAFEPEFAGKMNFYLSAVDDLLRHPDDEPSIGIVLCKTRERVVAEYALCDINKPIGISEYRLAESLSETLQGSLPTIESSRMSWAPDPSANLSKSFLRCGSQAEGQHRCASL